MKATRQGFGEGIVEAAKKNKNIVALTVDLAGSTGLLDFKKKFTKRFFDVGVAEQNLVTVASGLAHLGKIPFATGFAVFTPGRNWEQIRTTICYNDQPVTIVGTHTGLGVGEDGATHQMLEDIAMMRVLPNMQVIVPCDSEEARKATIAISKSKKPTYFRLGRQKVETVTKKSSPFKIGKANILKTGNKVTIIACGPMVQEALKAAEELKKDKVSAEVINLHTIKPLDKATLLRSIRKTKRVITVEDHQVHGGMGSAIAEMLSENYPVKMKIIGVNDSFGESGTIDELYAKYGLNASNIRKQTLKILK